MSVFWLFVVIGGPVLLGLALAWGKFQAGRRANKTDPRTPVDDPSRGM